MKVYLFLLRRMRPAWPQFALSLLLSVLSVFSSMGLMGCAAWLIASAALHPFIYEISLAIVGVRFFGLSRACLRYLERYVSHDATFRLLADFRLWCYSCLEPLVPGQIRLGQKGALLQLMTKSVDNLQDFYLRVLSPPLVAIIVITFFTIFASSFHSYAPLPVIAAFLLAGLIVPLITDRAKKSGAKKSDEWESMRKSLLLDIAQGAEEIALFAREAYYEAELNRLEKELASVQLRTIRITALDSALTGFFLPLSLWFLLLLLIPATHTGSLSGIWLTVLLLLAQSSFETATTLPAVWRYARTAQLSAKALLTLTAPQKKHPAATVNSAMLRPPFDLTIEKLCFGYTAAVPILKDLSFSLPYGNRIAIVGESGCGKSTLLALLVKFLTPSSGSIRFGGSEYSSISATEIRKQITVMLQDSHVFHTFLADNLAVTSPEATLEEHLAALTAADLAPHKESTKSGRPWYGLSGGEKRKLSLARLLLSDTPLYLLDEPFAHLDAASARAALNTLLDKTDGQSMIMITHQYIGLERMDEIIVLDDGRVAERGTFNELLQKKQYFYRLWQYRSCTLDNS